MKTRRHLIGAAAGAAALTAAPALGSETKFIAGLDGRIRSAAPGVTDPHVALARRCLDCATEIERLWEAHEQEYDRLTALLGEEGVRAEWDAPTPRTRLLSQILDRIDDLDREQERIAKLLSQRPARSLEGVAGKVMIARQLIDPRDDPYKTRNLLARAAADFKAFGISIHG
jgi:hypothetical protein